MNSKWKVLDGFLGRPGTTVFLWMNLVMLTVYGLLGVVGWNRYYYGLTEVLNSAEDSIPLARACFEEDELAIGYVFAVISFGVVGGGTQVLHNDYVKRFDEANKDLLTMPSPLPLNNIIVPVLWALLTMFLVMVSGYEHASILFNGIAVGHYVAAALLQLIPSIAKFAIVSVLAPGWGLALTPFFVGFPGSKCSFCSENTEYNPYQKFYSCQRHSCLLQLHVLTPFSPESGFTARLGHVTWCLIKKRFLRRSFRRSGNLTHNRELNHLVAAYHHLLT